MEEEFPHYYAGSTPVPPGQSGEPGELGARSQGRIPWRRPLALAAFVGLSVPGVRLLLVARELLVSPPELLFFLIPFALGAVLFAAAIVLAATCAGGAALVLGRPSARLHAFAGGCVAVLSGPGFFGAGAVAHQQGVLITSCGVALIVATIGRGAAADFGPMLPSTLGARRRGRRP